MMSCSFGTLCPSYNCMTSYLLHHLYCRSVKIIFDTEPVRGSKGWGPLVQWTDASLLICYTNINSTKHPLCQHVALWSSPHVQVMQIQFTKDNNPDAQNLQKLAERTGLSRRVIQVKPPTLWVESPGPRADTFVSVSVRSPPSGLVSELSSSSKEIRRPTFWLLPDDVVCS